MILLISGPSGVGKTTMYSFLKSIRRSSSNILLYDLDRIGYRNRPQSEPRGTNQWIIPYKEIVNLISGDAILFGLSHNFFNSVEDGNGRMIPSAFDSVDKIIIIDETPISNGHRGVQRDKDYRGGPCYDGNGKLKDFEYYKTNSQIFYSQCRALDMEMMNYKALANYIRSLWRGEFR
jgi:energy-coupling factor transporter ATP-binding protein EcfA2